MATLNERINEMLNRLEAAAASAMDDHQAGPRVTMQPSRYSYQPPEPEQAVEAGPGSVARMLEDKKELNPAQESMETTGHMQDTHVLPSISASAMVQGVVFAEILGRPLARRRGRGRYGF
ncbi:MAG: hypothetical protein GX173_04485 [Ruminococcaceae bacterium]|jgi:hypothetical protein|nr:hypothetical protein [Oscillospiraceae bacterium]